jgi:hypothetical protein
MADHIDRVTARIEHVRFQVGIETEAVGRVHAALPAPDAALAIDDRPGEFSLRPSFVAAHATNRSK